MKKRTMGRLLAAALCVLLAGCGTGDEKNAPAEPEPAPQTEPEVQPQEAPAAQPEPETQPPEVQTPPSQGEEPVPAQESAGEADGVAASYVGTWRDDARGTSGGRCFMEIACGDGVHYDIDIWWGSSAAETTHWQYTGTYDEIWKGIDYIGTRYREVTQADGSVEKTAELEEATGLLYLEDGALLWEDTFEHTGEGMKFNKEA